MSQDTQTIRRNFPVLGNMRYLLENLRPEIQQCRTKNPRIARAHHVVPDFIEDEDDETPFSRERRVLIYARSKGLSLAGKYVSTNAWRAGQSDTLPFGTKRAVYDTGSMNR
jgi:hypothetical protein